jgi:ATP-binding cassette subfamily B protein
MVNGVSILTMAAPKKSQKKPQKQARPKGPNVFGLLGPYKWFIAALVALTVAFNALNLVVPTLLRQAIDAYTNGTLVLSTTVLAFVLVAVSVFVLNYIQGIVQTVTAERVARDMRTKLTAKISEQDYASIQELTPSKLLTNLTSDIDAIKNFVAMAVSSIVSSLFLIIGASVLLILINWKLALIVLLVVPFIGITFAVVFGKVRVLFASAQETIDWLNKVINESILGAPLIRILNAQPVEFQKFLEANNKAMGIGYKIIAMFATLLPIMFFATNLATIAILALGGHYVISGNMTLGDFMAFNSYLALLVFPIFVLGFMSSIIAQATASYGRVSEVLNKKPRTDIGKEIAKAGQDVEVKNVSVVYGEKTALKNVSFVAKAGTRNAIIGPTAAGKSQVLFLLTGLLDPKEGSIEYGGKPLKEYDPVSLHERIAFVFQDSVIFNLSLRENIAFSTHATDADMQKAIDTAELHDFVDALPEKLDTMVSERGTSLSGGQKQRIMLARALALNPSVLLLDDFTARVDAPTEKKILENVHKNYPGITILSVTQKIAPVEDYDNIILLMEGELLAQGTHAELMKNSPEYVQIYESQHSTSSYELQPE